MTPTDATTFYNGKLDNLDFKHCSYRWGTQTVVTVLFLNKFSTLDKTKTKGTLIDSESHVNLYPCLDTFCSCVTHIIYACTATVPVISLHRPTLLVISNLKRFKNNIKKVCAFSTRCLSALSGKSPSTQPAPGISVVEVSHGIFHLSFW